MATRRASASPLVRASNLLWPPVCLTLRAEEARGTICEPRGNLKCNLSSLPGRRPASAGRPQNCCSIADSVYSAACASRLTPTASRANSARISPRFCSMSPTRPRSWPPRVRSARRSAARRCLASSTMPESRSLGLLQLAADEFRRQMDINVIGPIISTQAFGPLLGADSSLKGKPGRIVMISSVAGKNGNPLASAYSASKHAIEGLSESLRREMMLFGIDVIIVAPGAAKTPIWSKADDVDVSVYKNSPYAPALEKVRQFTKHLGEIGLPPEKIAEVIAEALTGASPKVRYQITPDPIRHLITAVLPKRMVDKIIAKRLGLMPPA